MNKIKSSVLKNVLSTLAFISMLLGVVVTPAIATQGDFYDTETLTHYSVSGLSTAAKNELNTAYSNGHKIIKEQAADKYLDYNGAYDLFSSLMLDGVSLEDTFAAVVTNTTLHPLIDPRDYIGYDETLSVASVNDINVTTVAGTVPLLPSTVTAIMSDGTTKTVNVTWVTPTSSQYASVGTFTVSGAIAESTVIKAVATITVTKSEATISSIENIIKTVNQGDIYSLPSTVEAIMSDGSKKQVAVTWNPSTVNTSKVGTYIFSGSTIEGKTGICKVTVIPVTITSASVAINGTVLVTLSPSTLETLESSYSDVIPEKIPVIADFAVTASGIAVKPTAISATYEIVTLTIPPANDQTVIYSVSYKGGDPVVANIEVSNMASNNIKVGQHFSVPLQEYGSVAPPWQGMIWTYTTNDDAIKLIQTTDASPLPAIGAGTLTIWTFQATQKGSFILHFSRGSETHDYIINVTQP